MGPFLKMRGFSLIELIVTLGLLAILVVGVFGLYVNGIRAGLHAQGLAVASALGSGSNRDAQK